MKPEKGEGYEAGVKAELLGGKLLTTLASFDIPRHNVATADPNNFIGGFQIAAGEQKTRGVELDLSGQILPGWNIIAAYTYTDATVTKDTNALLVGSTLPNIPKNSASLWTTYE
ncbi:MAG: TonB-dependent receptor domain-containing protein, partial [Nostoc sp.]